MPLVLVLFLLHYADVWAGTEPTLGPNPSPFNAVGLELSGPGLTVRRVAEKYSLLLDAGFLINGTYSFRKGKADLASQAWIPGEFEFLYRYHWLRIGKSVNLHLATGLATVLVPGWNAYLGTGLSINKQIEDHLFVFLDSDLAFIESTFASDISYQVFSNERIRFGLLMGF